MKKAHNAADVTDGDDNGGAGEAEERTGQADPSHNRAEVCKHARSCCSLAHH